MGIEYARSDASNNASGYFEKDKDSKHKIKKYFEVSQPFDAISSCLIHHSEVHLFFIFQCVLLFDIYLCFLYLEHTRLDMFCVCL